MVNFTLRSTTNEKISISTSQNFRSWVVILLWVVSMEHLQRVWHASRERLPFRTPSSVPHCGTCLCANCWDQIPRTCHVFTRLFTSNTPWYFFDFALNNDKNLLIDLQLFSYILEKFSFCSCPPRWRRGSGLDFGSEDPGSIPRLPSPRLDPPMARR